MNHATFAALVGEMRRYQRKLEVARMAKCAAKKADLERMQQLQGMVDAELKVMGGRCVACQCVEDRL